MSGCFAIAVGFTPLAFSFCTASAYRRAVGARAFSEPLSSHWQSLRTASPAAKRGRIRPLRHGMVSMASVSLPVGVDVSTSLPLMALRRDRIVPHQTRWLL
jgi:hypothetical protein